MNQYDQVLEQFFHVLGGPLLKLFFGFQVDRIRTLALDFSIVEERHVDYLALVEHNKQESYVHLEFQSSNNMHMPARMLNYASHIFREYSVQPLYQAVVYIGKEPLRMEDKTSYTTPLSHMEYQYHILNIADVDAAIFTQATEVELMVFALLAKTDSPTAVMETVLEAVKNKIPSDKRSEYIAFVSILVQLRPELGEIFLQEAKHLGIQVKIEDNVLYKEGRQEGRQEELIKSIILLVRLKYKATEQVQEEVREDLTQLQDLAKLEAIQSAVMEINSFDDFQKHYKAL